MYTSGFVWNEEKNLKLRKERGIDFETIVDLIELGDFMVFENPSSIHEGQAVFIVKNDPYPYVVPFRVEANGDVLLITIFQSRKFKTLFSEE
jgi:uncharacterized DUF497 family protein